MNEFIKVAAKKPEAKRENRASQTQKTGPSQSISSPVEQILFLQRTIGNQAVGRLIKSGALQAKLRIGQPGDKYEQEADRVAEQVMRMPEPQVLNETKVSNPARNNAIQRKCPGCKKGTKIEKEEEEEKIQKKEASGSTPEVTPELESSISAIRRGGQPLSESMRAFYEPRFDADFSNVNIHTGTDAIEMNKGLEAQAFTHGSDIYFNEGKYDPESSSGKHLLAHELAHTLQQGSGPVEREAEAVAHTVIESSVADRPTPVLRWLSASKIRDPLIARQSADASSLPLTPDTAAAADAIRHALGSGKGSEVMKLDDAALATTNPTQRAGLVKILTDQLWTSKADEQATMKLIRLKGEHMAVLAQLDALGYRQKLLDSIDDDAMHKELEGLFGSAPTAGTGPVAAALASRTSEDVQKIPYPDLKAANKQQRIALLQIMLDLSSSNAAEEGRILDILESSYSDIKPVIADVKALGLKQRLFDHIDNDVQKQRLTTLLKPLGDPELDADLVVFNRSFFGNVVEGVKKGFNSAVENFSIGALVMGMLQPIIHPIDTVSKHIDDAVQVIKMPSVDGVIALLRDIFGTLGMWLLVAAGVVALVGLAVSAGVITLPAGIAIEGVAAALLTAATWCGVAFIVLTIIKLLLDTGEAGAATTAQEHETESKEIGEGMTALAVIAVLAGLLKGLGRIVKGLRGAADDPAKADPDALKKQAADAKDSQSKATDEANRLKDAAEKKESRGSKEKPGFKKGVYEAADPANTPKEWKFTDKPVWEEGDVRFAETEFEAPSPKEGAPRPIGMGKRAVNTKTGALELHEINVPREAGWIETESPVVEGKGTRTAAYVTMRLMRILGIAAGSLKSIVVRNIWNLRAVLELRQLEAQGIPRNRAVLETNSVTSQETALTQSGHRISGAKVTGGRWATLKELLDYWETKRETLKEADPEIAKQHDKILKDFGLSREQATSQKFFWDYDIEISLEAAEGGAPTPKGTGIPPIIPVLPKADSEDEEGTK